MQYIVDAAFETQASAIVLLGDIEPTRPLQDELAAIIDRVWWIQGNHDADSDDLWRRVSTPAMQMRSLHSRVVTLPDGIRVAGLGGVFRESVWYPKSKSAPSRPPMFRTRAEHAKSTPRQDRWEGGHHRKHWGTIYPGEVEQMAQLHADVLVTHEAPGYHPLGFEALDELARAMRVKVIVHGHVHDRTDSSARWSAQGFKTFGVGLRGISAIELAGNVKVIRPGESDGSTS